MVHYYMIQDEFCKHENFLMDMMKERNSYSETLFKVDEELDDFKKSLETQLELLKIINEKIENRSLEKNELKKKLESLELKMEEIRKIMNNTTVVTPITVDEDVTDYRIENGLVNVNRDIVMRLLRIIRDGTKIRNIIGIGEVFYVWSKQPIFCWIKRALNAKLHVRFIPDKKNRGVTNIKRGRITWVMNGNDWAIVHKEMKKGIYSMTVDFEIAPDIFIGLITKGLLREERYKWLYNESGQCCIGVGGGGIMQYIAGSSNTDYYQGKDLFPLTGKVTLRLEVNMDARTLCFFVDGKQLPHVVSRVPSPVFFTICCGGKGRVVTVTRLEALRNATIATPHSGAVYGWI